jgi:hypothetical protein
MEKRMPESDKTLPENSKENLDRKLDHAVEETFPTSDPVSVQITKGGAIDYDEHGNAISHESGGSGQNTSGSAEGVVIRRKRRSAPSPTVPQRLPVEPSIRA